MEEIAGMGQGQMQQPYPQQYYSQEYQQQYAPSRAQVEQYFQKGNPVMNPYQNQYHPQVQSAPGGNSTAYDYAGGYDPSNPFDGGDPNHPGFSERQEYLRNVDPQQGSGRLYAERGPKKPSPIVDFLSTSNVFGQIVKKSSSPVFMDSFFPLVKNFLEVVKTKIHLKVGVLKKNPKLPDEYRKTLGSIFRFTDLKETKAESRSFIWKVNVIEKNKTFYILCYEDKASIVYSEDEGATYVEEYIESVGDDAIDPDSYAALSVFTAIQNQFARIYGINEEQASFADEGTNSSSADGILGETTSDKPSEW